VSSLAFLHPLLLGGLAVLPALWWLLRVVPPGPKVQPFPAIRLLFRLARREETPHRMPLWLLVLRILVATLIVIALAGPILNPGQRLAGKGPVLIVVDDGVLAASRWSGRRLAMLDAIGRAARQRRPVILLGTAPPIGTTAATPLPTLQVLSAAGARRRAGEMAPKPWPVDRQRAARIIAGATIAPTSQAIWFSDGLDSAGRAELFARLRRFSGLEYFTDDGGGGPYVLLPPAEENNALLIDVARPRAGQARDVTIRATAVGGRIISRATASFAPGAEVARARIDLPLALRNDIRRIALEGEASAATTLLLDESWHRRTVGLVADQSVEERQPLLSATYYLKKALTPFAEVREGLIGELLDAGVAVLMLADVADFTGLEKKSLQNWLESGGVLVRFSGPRLANAERPALLPVRPRGGGRAMGGAMSWEQPARLAPFAATSPFAGLPLPDDVVIKRQILAEPTADLAQHVWVRLADGTPLVTARAQGKGWLILFHVTANNDWSNLPISGLFVDMLRRITALSRRATVRGVAAKNLRPLRLLDGFGVLGEADPAVGPVSFGTPPPIAGPASPPGLYGSDQAPRALNLMSRGGPIDTSFRLRPIADIPAGVVKRGYSAAPTVDIGRWLLAAALVLALADFAITLYLRGLIGPGHRGRAAAVMLLLAIVPILSAPPARAQGSDKAGVEKQALAGALQLHFAYVITGNRRLDAISAAGLKRLGEALSRRSTVDPRPPVGVRPGVDEIAFFPLLYWPMAAGGAAPSEAAVRRLDRYLATGGILLVDNRHDEAARQTMRRVLARLKIPPLIRLPRDHVLTRSFYLLERIPGFLDSREIWVERYAGDVNDGVSPVIITDGGWATSWALGTAAGGLLLSDQEAAVRFGINLVMYALTGNYKADQVHVPTVLQRLGR